MNALIQEAFEAFEPIASAKGISLKKIAWNGSLFAQFDHDRILQVLANFLSNAIKFSSKGGEIVLRVDLIAGEIRFCVSDTGVGIAGDQLEYVFERFWQVAKDDRRGLGLGMFISKCIVEAHGGRIWVESTLNKGSTFCFTLPGAIEK